MNTHPPSVDQPMDPPAHLPHTEDEHIDIDESSMHHYVTITINIVPYLRQSSTASPPTTPLPVSARASSRRTLTKLMQAAPRRCQPTPACIGHSTSPAPDDADATWLPAPRPQMAGILHAHGPIFMLHDFALGGEEHAMGRTRKWKWRKRKGAQALYSAYMI